MAESGALASTLSFLTVLGYGVGAGAWAASLRAPRPWLRAARHATAAGFAFHTGVLAARWEAAGYAPFAGPGESFFFFLWALAAALLAADAFGRVRTLGAFVMPPLAVSTLATYLAGPSTGEPPVHFRTPAAAAHMVLALLGYAFFVIGFAAGVLYLAENRALKRRRLGGVSRSLPPLEALERLNVASVATGHLLLTGALALGAAYALRVSGVRWGRDPAVLASAGLWILGAVLLALRWGRGVRGRKIAILTACGFFLVVLSMFATRVLSHAEGPRVAAGAGAEGGR